MEQLNSVTISKASGNIIAEMVNLEITERRIEKLIGTVETDCGKFIRDSDKNDIRCSFLNISSTLGTILESAVRNSIEQTPTDDLNAGRVII